MKNNIQFYWNGSFVGTIYSMIINNNQIGLGEPIATEKDAKQEAIRILKENYNLEYKEENINFEWGGCL